MGRVRYHSSEMPFKRGRYTGAASPIRFIKVQDRETFTWMVVVGVSGLPLAKGPAASVSEGMAIFRDAEDRYWRRRKSARPKKRII
jgi:hypothetical protein